MVTLGPDRGCHSHSVTLYKPYITLMIIILITILILSFDIHYSIFI